MGSSSKYKDESTTTHLHILTKTTNKRMYFNNSSNRQADHEVVVSKTHGIKHENIL